jgi:hypothetical protein
LGGFPGWLQDPPRNPGTRFGGPPISCKVTFGVLGVSPGSTGAEKNSKKKFLKKKFYKKKFCVAKKKIFEKKILMMMKKKFL